MKHLGLKIGILSLAAAGFASADLVCPAVGATATGCGALITITDDGLNDGGLLFNVTEPGNGNPYDGTEDTLVGVVNNSASQTVSAISLSSSLAIFGLDNDGMCLSTFYGQGAIGTNSCSASDAAGTDPGDYSGDAVSFSITDTQDGIVTFIGGLAPGATQFFSLEENIAGGVQDGGSFSAGSASPEPGTIALLGIGLGLVLFGRRRIAAR